MSLLEAVRRVFENAVGNPDQAWPDQAWPIGRTQPSPQPSATMRPRGEQARLGIDSATIDTWLGETRPTIDGSFAAVPTLACPVDGPFVITSSFGWRPKYHASHNGNDIRNGPGMPVYSTHDGIVASLPDPNGKGGNSVIMQNADGSISGYAHSRPSVHSGQKIRAGELIARTDLSGHADGPHLHYTFRPGAAAAKIDPRDILRRACGLPPLRR